MDTAQSLSKIFKALSSETRLRIVHLLRNKPLCVGALVARLDVTQAAVSQHLGVLKSADIVVAEKHGCFIHYSLNTKTLEAWQKTAATFLSTGKRSGKPTSIHTAQTKGDKQCARKKKAVRSRNT